MSSDTFQSATIQQELKADGFKTEILSVDRVDQQSRICLPYQYLKSAIYERRIEIYKKCDLLTDELVGLERMSNGKIDHTPDGINSKDQADAVCGALYLASKFSEEYSYSYGDNLDATLEANLEASTDTGLKRQMIADFEAELTNVYAELDAVRNKQTQAEQQQQKEEYEYYQNLSNGIIVI